MTWLGWIVTILLLVVIGLLVWYVKNLLARIYFFIEDVKTIKKITRDFGNHLEKIYSMDMFYGDTTLEDLIKHAKFLNKELKSFESVFDNIEIKENKETDVDGTRTDETAETK